jgi:DNA modification methylase
VSDKEVLRPIATLEDLGPDPANANKGTDKGRAIVAASLAECGAGRSILADRDGTVIAGNKTLEAAKRLGLSVRVVESTGDELVVVRRTDLVLDADEKARRLAYLDNRAGQLGLDSDTEQLLEDLRRGVDLEGVFDDAELKELLGNTGAGGNAAKDPGAQLDRADELQEKWGVERGQLWLAGKHRILCGDCVDETQAQKVMGGGLAAICWTDPPWNVAYGENNHPSWKKRSIQNDNLGAEFPAFASQFCTIIAQCLVAGAPIYMAMSAQEWPTIDQALRVAGSHWSSTIIWVKDHAVLSRKDYHTRYEPIWYGWKGGAPRLAQLDDRTQNDVWEINCPTRSDEHPTMKPVELVARALLNSSRPGDVVFEPFLGSGTTTVAAEQTGRICCGMEIEPSYVAVTLERLAGMGLEPRLT